MGAGLADEGVYCFLAQGKNANAQAHPSDDVLFVQVGSSTIDNSYW